MICTIGGTLKVAIDKNGYIIRENELNNLSPAERELRISVASKEDEKAKLRCKEIAEHLLKGDMVCVDKDCSYCFSKNNDEITASLTISSSSLEFINHADCRVSLKTGLFEIDCSGGRFVISDLFDEQESEYEMSHIWDVCYKAMRIIERISTLYFSIDGRDLGLIRLDENRKTVQKLNWKDVLKWISNSPIRILTYDSIELPKIIID